MPTQDARVPSMHLSPQTALDIHTQDTSRTLAVYSLRLEISASSGDHGDDTRWRCGECARSLNVSLGCNIRGTVARFRTAGGEWRAFPFITSEGRRLFEFSLHWFESPGRCCDSAGSYPTLTCPEPGQRPCLIAGSRSFLKNLFWCSMSALHRGTYVGRCFVQPFRSHSSQPAAVVSQRPTGFSTSELNIHPAKLASALGTSLKSSGLTSDV